MGVIDTPEVNLARRVLAKRPMPLLPPIDVEALIKEYASLSFAPFPFSGIDGVCVNIKGGISKAKVIINSAIPSTRQKFTMAHELGHLVIPWHIGSIVDNIDPTSGAASANEYEYLELEGEANRFAAELLMPSDWVEEKIQSIPDLAQLHQNITRIAGVSPQAAAIRLEAMLPPNIVYCIEMSGLVQATGNSLGTSTPHLWRGHRFEESLFSYAEQHTTWDSGSSTIHWWKLPIAIVVQDTDQRPWREILDGMVADQHYADPTHEKRSINGILAAGNGDIKRNAHFDKSLKYNVDTIVAYCLQRFSRSELSGLTKHKDFMLFLKKRAEELYANSVAKGPSNYAAFKAHNNIQDPF